MSRLHTFIKPHHVRSSLAGAGLLLIGAACSNDATAPIAPGFLGGTSDNHEIGIVVNSTSNTLALFQVGSPATQKQIALGASSTVTPVGFSISGRRAAVPLGNAGSVALIDLETQAVTRFFTFASGNATGSAFVDDTTIVTANTTTNVLGKMTVGQAATAIATTVPVGDSPTSVVAANGRIMVVCGNLHGAFPATIPGVVMFIDPKTFTVVDSVKTGLNPLDAAVGPDGLLYVVNAADFSSPGSLTIIDPATRQVVTTVNNFGAGPGSISIDKSGLAYISSFSAGTLVWNTKTRAFVRGPDNPVCAKIAASGLCRGASSATASADGTVYQLFFGSSRQGLASYTFVYAPGTFALRDSVSVGTGPSSIQVRTF